MHVHFYQCAFYGPLAILFEKYKAFASWYIFYCLSYVLS